MGRIAGQGHATVHIVFNLSFAHAEFAFPMDGGNFPFGTRAGIEQRLNFFIARFYPFGIFVGWPTIGDDPPTGFTDRE